LRSADELAAAIVRAWTRAYTAWLAPTIREARRAEIDSDLWEHAHAANEAADPRTVAGQILARCLLGIGGDLTWRVQMAAGPGRLEKEGIPMNERVKRNWWVPAPIVLSGLSVLFQLTHVGNGSGSDPSSPEWVRAIVIVGSLFVVLPIWALVIRNRHPGWTVVMLLPIGLFSLGPLVWGEVTGFLVLPALGIVTLVGAIVNLSQRSLEEGPEPSSREAQHTHG
jgi:uncharacterized membrane protein YhaH (DUF805 family)